LKTKEGIERGKRKIILKRKTHNQIKEKTNKTGFTSVDLNALALNSQTLPRQYTLCILKQIPQYLDPFNTIIIIKN